MTWSQVSFIEAVQARGSGSSGLPQSEWSESGQFPVIGQGAAFIEGWTDREDLVLRPNPAVVLYGGHTRRAKFVDRPFVPGPNIRILEPGKGLDAKFLFHYLAQLHVESRGYADHFPEVRRCSVPMPSLAEQRRIAAILDKADALRAKRREAIAKLDQLLRSVFLNMFGDPLSNSMGWRSGALKELGRVQTGATPPSSEPDAFGGDIPFVTPGDLGGLISTTKRSVTTRGAALVRSVDAGSTLVCCIGATIGKMGLVTKSSTFNQQINAVTWFDDMDADYGYHALTFFAREIAVRGASTTLPILKKSSFEKLVIPVPPLERQAKFASLAAAIRRTRQRAELSCTALELVSASLQQRAFAGAL